MNTTAPDSGTTSGGLPAGTDVAVRIRGLRKAYGRGAAVVGLGHDPARRETVPLRGPPAARQTSPDAGLEG